MTTASDASVIRIIIADDDPIARAAIKSMFDEEDDIEVVAVAADGAEAVDLVHTHMVDVALMDAHMPVLDGIAATRRLEQTSSGTRSLILTSFDDDTYLDTGIAAGAYGFLLKTTPPSEVVAAVRTVHSGGKVLSPGPAGRVLDRYVHGQFPRTASAADLDLSEREQEVLLLLCEAMSNQQIATRLMIAETTVKTHIASIMRKMHVSSRLEVVVEAYHQGLATARS